MSDSEGFLARWARRKRGGTQDARDPPMPKKRGDDAASRTVAASLPRQEARSLVDPANLPPIESIGPGSDIRPFLAAGVPTDLMRAALRRAWSADPAIRGFIGLSENAWDFNAAGAVPGFGSLAAEDARRLLARLDGEPEVLDPASQSGQPAAASSADQVKLVGDSGADHHNSISRVESRNIATQHEREERPSRPTFALRRHGGALPN
jgi:hypothetical protein